MAVRFNQINGLRTADCSPEKAGVGGSIPSLATLFSIIYRPLNPSICSILFQFQMQARQDLSQKQSGRIVRLRLWNGSGSASI